MDLFDIAVARKLSSGGGGGGGSSDFSTAEVTIYGGGIVEESCPEIYLMCINEGNEFVAHINLEDSETTVSAVLYKGEQEDVFMFDRTGNIPTSSDITLTGDIDFYEKDGEELIIITGAGTITIS